MDIESLHGLDEKEWIRRAKDDDEVTAITKEFEGRGWSFRSEESAALLTEKTGTNYHTVVLYFDTPSSDQQANITWTESNVFDTHGGHYRKIQPKQQTRNWEITSFYVVDNVVKSTRSVIPKFYDCDDVDWDCIRKIAGSYAAVIGACGACAGTLGAVSCMSCLGAVLVRSADPLPCEWCNDSN